MKLKTTFSVFFFSLCFAMITTHTSAQALAANAGNSQSICNGSSVQIGGSPTATGGVPGYTYSWSPATGLSSTTIANPMASPTTYTNYTVTVSDNNGGSASASVVVSVDAIPTISNATLTQQICSGGTATFNPTSNVVGATFSYTAFASSPNVSGYSSSGSGIINEVLTNTGTTTETVTYSITPTGPGPTFCVGTPVNYVVTVVPANTIANAGTNQNICGTTATLAGNVPTVGTGTWTLIAGAGFVTNPSNPASTITSLATGNNVFQWTISSNFCAGTSSQVTINGTSSPTVAVAGPNQALCGTNATLAGNTALIGVGVWTLVSGSGTITNSAVAISGLTNLGFGPNVFQWTISNPPCAASSTQVTITAIGAPTTANAGSDQMLCGTTTATLAGNTPVSGNGLWSLVSGSGIITAPSSPNSTFTGLGAGANVFQWTISAPPCGTSSDQVSISPTPDGVPICLVTVDSLSTHNIVVWEKSGVLSSTLLFKIYREDVTNVYTYISSVMFDSLSVYHDYASNPNITGKRYKISLLDSCYTESAKSPYHNTIWLNYLGNGILSWTPYLIEGQANPVTQYNIYRDDLGTGNWALLGSTAGTQLGYTDIAYASYPAANYKVEVVWAFSCTPTRAVNTSWSNFTQHSIGINETTLQNSITISPNPFTSQTIISFDREMKNTILYVKDVLGKEIKTILFSGKELTLEKGDMEKGIYFIQIENTNRKIIIE